MEWIGSIQNPKVKLWGKLHTRKGREQSKSYLIEGIHLLEEAIKANSAIEAVIMDEQLIPSTFVQQYITQSSINCYQVSSAIMEKISQTQSPQGISAVIAMQTTTLDNLLDHVDDRSIFLLIDAVQDPGNLGTIIRTADAAGAQGVILGNGTVDPFNDKVIRSTMGSLFHLPIIQTDLSSCIHALRRSRVRIIATSLEEAMMYNEPLYDGPLAIVIGNEANGVSPAVIELANVKVKIPIYGQAESLNAGVAASILLYEAVRQKRITQDASVQGR
jgi:TrmH family RNA methyltransferase